MAVTSDSLSLVGKVAIVTGSGKENGIGAGIALTLAKAGARVVINYMSDSTAARAVQVVERIEKAAGKGSAIVVQADISNPEGAEKIVKETLSGFGVDHVDILVNNAAWVTTGPVMTASPQDIQKSFASNVFGPMYVIKATVPHMPRGGRIINIGTVASKLNISGMPFYTASKAALDALTHSLARELGREGKGITINTVSPGPVGTDSIPPNGEAQEFVDWLQNLTRAEDRLGTVDDIADAVLLLANERSRWITGQYISVSGGITGN